MNAKTVFGLSVLALLWCPRYAALAQSDGAELAPYTIQAGDVLEISVWKEPDLIKEVLVRPDGKFSFPLTGGDTLAFNQTVEQLRQEISDRLSKYISDPVVTVTIKETLGNKIFVIGKVANPGEYILNRPVDVVQALSMAGGMITFSALNDIKILRRTNNKQEAIPFRYGDVEKGKNLDQNIMLRVGDIIIVP